jgi:hypothetical protein
MIWPLMPHTLETLATKKVQYGHSWMRAAVKSRKDQQSSQIEPHAELNSYLNAPLEDHVEDVVLWWGVRALFIQQELRSR